MKTYGLAALAMFALSGCLSALPVRDEFTGQYDRTTVDKLIKDASAHPLGSRANPVRANMPMGQRAYLARLRCADGRAPTFERTGNLGPGIYGSTIDNYRVTCAGSTPAETDIVMDMYFSDHAETLAVPGFTIVAR